MSRKGKFLLLFAVFYMMSLFLFNSPVIAANNTGNASVPQPPISLNMTFPGVESSQDLGQLSSGAELPLIFYLRSKDPAGLKSYAEGVNDPDSPNYHQFLTHDQTMEEFGPNPSDAAAVSTFLLKHGIPSQSTSDGSGLRCNVSSGLIDQMFSTTMHRFTRNGQNFTAPAGPLTLPAAMSSVVYIEGLDTYHRVSDNLTTPPGSIRNGATETQAEEDWLFLRNMFSIRPYMNSHPKPRPVTNNSSLNTNQNDSLEWETIPNNETETEAPVGTPEPITVQVVGADGNPVAGMSVELSQTQMIYGDTSGSPSSAVIKSGSNSGSPGQNIIGSSDSNGEVSFTVYDNVDEATSFSASLVNSNGNLYESASPSIFVAWYQNAGVQVATGTNQASGQNITYTATVTNAVYGDGVAGLEIYASLQNLPQGSYYYEGGTNYDYPVTNSSGVANCWIMSPTQVTTPIDVWATNGIQYYLGQSNSVTWSGNPVVEMNSVPGSTTDTAQGATPQQVNTAYGATSFLKSAVTSKATIGLYGESSFTQSDISSYFTGFGLTAPSVNVVPVDGSLSDVNDVPGWDDETEFDIERAGSSAPGRRSSSTPWRMSTPKAISPAAKTPWMSSMPWCPRRRQVFKLRSCVSL